MPDGVYFNADVHCEGRNCLINKCKKEVFDTQLFELTEMHVKHNLNNSLFIFYNCMCT